MHILIKNNFKLFFKSRYLLLGIIIFFITVNVYLSEGLYGLSIRENTLYYLKQSQMLSVVYFVFFVFISYEYLIKSKNANLLEGFAAINNGKIILYLSKLIVLIILTLIMTLNIMIYNYVAYFAMNINSLSFALHILSNNVLNITIVSLIGASIGAIAALYLKRFPAYLLIILISILISPIVDIIPYILFMGFEVNIYPLRDIFNILPPNLNWVAEALYGLSVEPYRWNLNIFWISLLASFILLKLNNKKIKLVIYLSMILISFSIYNFYLFTEPGSIVRKDYNPKNYIAFDELYYLKDVQKEEDAGFTINSYNMQINIDRQLENDVLITLDEKEPLKNYKFTLYRKYNIKEIFDKNGELIEFKRDGDYFEVLNSTNDKLENIRIIYSGYSPVFYSNSQGVLLPGCFPYYPIEGYGKIYLKQQSAYIPVIRDYNVKFNVSVKSHTNIYSNLDKEGNNFVGQAQAVTLIGGFVNEEKYNNIVLYELPLEKINPDNLVRIEEILESYKTIIPEIEKVNIKSIKIFQSPATFTSRIIDNSIVSFKDHIFMYNLDEDNIVQGVLQTYIPHDANKLETKNAFFTYILHKERLLNIPKDQLENKTFEFRRIFIEKINELGENYVLNCTYDFLMNKEDTRDSITFIKNLK